MQNELAQRIILQSNLWDSEKVKIKRHRHPEAPLIWKYKAEYGVPDHQIVYVYVLLTCLRNTINL